MAAETTEAPKKTPTAPPPKTTSSTSSSVVKINVLLSAMLVRTLNLSFQNPVPIVEVVKKTAQAPHPTSTSSSVVPIIILLFAIFVRTLFFQNPQKSAPPKISLSLSNDLLALHQKPVKKISLAKQADDKYRADLAADIGRNVVHRADSPESAKREISIYFDDKELLSNWSKTIDCWVWE